MSDLFGNLFDALGKSLGNPEQNDPDHDRGDAGVLRDLEFLLQDQTTEQERNDAVGRDHRRGDDGLARHGEDVEDLSELLAESGGTLVPPNMGYGRQNYHRLSIDDEQGFRGDRGQVAVWC